MDCTLHSYRAAQSPAEHAAFQAACCKQVLLLDLYVLLERGSWPRLALLTAAAVLTAALSLVNMEHMSAKFLSFSIAGLRKLFALSALAAAVTLVPLVSDVPDVVSAYNSATQTSAAGIAVENLISTFIFTSKVIVGNVVMRSPRVVIPVPTASFLKEMGFFAVGVGLMAALSRAPRVRMWHAAVPLVLLAAYYAVSVGLVRLEQEAPPPKPPKPPKPRRARLPLGPALWAHLWQPPRSAASLLFSPFKLLYVLTIPYKSNLLSHRWTKYLVVLNLLLLDVRLLSSPPLFLGACIGGLFCLFGLYLAFHLRPSAAKRLAFELFTVPSTVQWLRIYAQLLSDGVSFLSFMVSLRQAYVGIFISSISNSLSNLFTADSIASAGEDTMAIMSSFSGQVLSLFAGLAIFLYFAAARELETFRAASGRGEEDVVVLDLLLACSIFFNVFEVYRHRGFSKAYVRRSLWFYAAFLVIITAYVFIQS